LFRTFVHLAPQLEVWGADAGLEHMTAAGRAELVELDQDFVDDLVMITSSVAYAGLSMWAADKLSLEEAWTRIERTVRLLLGPQPSGG
jgi:hypothetical protein